MVVVIHKWLKQYAFLHADFLASEYRKQHSGAAVSRELHESMRAHLTSCGIAQELQLVPGRALSGGQRSRLAMACVSFLRPHVLVLDGAHDARLMIQERKKKNLSFSTYPKSKKISLVC